jgi:hypothetical protein
MSDSGLRPIERRVRHLTEAGMDDVEIAWRFRRSPRYVRQVRELSAHPRRGAVTDGQRLRPIERRVLSWRDRGAAFEDMAPRFRRGVDYLRQVEHLANYKLRGSA